LAKHKDHPPLGDWQVIPSGDPDGYFTAVGTWWRRDKRGGYTFYDSEGAISADFPPGSVDSVRRVPSQPAASAGDYSEAAR
jgi:hypothetical protein